MRKLLIAAILSLALTTGAQAQIKLMGVAYNQTTEAIDLMQWEMFDESTVTTVPTTLDAYLFATSSYNHLKGNYYITGISGGTTGLYAHNTITGESSLTSGSEYSNIAEFDMSNGKMYNLRMETEGYISIYEYDIEMNQDSLIGTIHEPGVMGIVTDAIGFDSNNGILYYSGFTADQNLALYAVPVRDEVFSFTRTILNVTNAASNVTSLNFDNVNGKLFAARDGFDAMGNSTGRSIVEINTVTGEVIELGELSEFEYFVGGSSLFDQNSGKFILVGITGNNELQMIAFNTYTNTYETGFVPNNVSEIVCDNTMFARNRYLAANVESKEAMNVSAYPNPVSEMLNLEWSSNEPVQLQIISSVGELVYSANNTAVSKTNVDMSVFAPGIYTINLTGGKSTLSKKIVVQ
jgi:hypothetical protein